MSSPTATHETAVFASDVHVPFQDETALRVAKQIIAEVQPDLFVLGGDWLDATQISRFDPDPRRKLTLQNDLDACKLLIREFRALLPNSRFVYKVGNHEDRIRKWASRNPEMGILDCIKLEALLDLEAVECEVVESTSRFSWNGWSITHGDIARKRAGATSQALIDKFGTSGVSGHCHRLATVEKRDANRQYCWIESGCLCSLTPDYNEVADWAQGFTILNKTASGVWPETVRIVEGRAWLWGRVYGD